MNSLNFKMYVDTDFANLNNGKSVSGYSSNIGGSCAMWSSKKQSLSTMEAEYIAITHGAKKLVWLCQLLSDLGIDISSPFPMLYDNLAAITISKDNSYHTRMKHINICYHYIRECLASCKATLNHVMSKDNAADIFMKALDPKQHTKLMSLLRMGEMLH